MNRPARLSLPEIGALVWRASRGAGRSWDEAEEIAAAAVWLARAGLGWAGPLLAVLTGGEGMPAPAPACGPPDPRPGLWRAVGGGPLCPLRCGMALADFACLPEGPGAGPVRLAGVVQPVLLLPFAAVAAGYLGQDLRLGWPGGDLCVTQEGMRTGRPPITAGPLDLTVAPVPRRADALPGPRPVEGVLRPEDLDRLAALALRMTVPTSLQSQSGAGAAGTDND